MFRSSVNTRACARSGYDARPDDGHGLGLGLGLGLVSFGVELLLKSMRTTNGEWEGEGVEVGGRRWSGKRGGIEGQRR